MVTPCSRQLFEGRFLCTMTILDPYCCNTSRDISTDNSINDEASKLLILLAFLLSEFYNGPVTTLKTNDIFLLYDKTLDNRYCMWNIFFALSRASEPMICFHLSEVVIALISTFSTHGSWVKFFAASNNVSTTNSPHHPWCRIWAKWLSNQPLGRGYFPIGKALTRRRASAQLLSYLKHGLMARNKETPSGINNSRPNSTVFLLK